MLVAAVFPPFSFAPGINLVARVATVAFEGTPVLDIDVQVQLSAGLVAFNIVALPDKAVAESRERVRAALHALGLPLPAKRITVNLAPADVLKEGSHFDLPIALATLAAMGVLPVEEMGQYTALGEVALDGALSPVAGVLAAAVKANEKERGVICPLRNGGEAVWAGESLNVVAARFEIRTTSRWSAVFKDLSAITYCASCWVVIGPFVRRAENRIRDTSPLNATLRGGTGFCLIWSRPMSGLNSRMAASRLSRSMTSCRNIV